MERGEERAKAEKLKFGKLKQRSDNRDRRAETGAERSETDWSGATAAQRDRRGARSNLKAEGKVQRSEVGEPSGSESLRVGERYDFLVYDKVRWEHERYEKELIEPIRQELRRRGFSFREIRYGSYEEEDYQKALQECRAMIFLCEHETQGFAYLQALSCDVPVLAWDRGGSWQDPTYFPDRVKFSGVSSVPYWDDKCGVKFTVASGFSKALDDFKERRNRGVLQPRDFVLKNFDLADRARHYLELVQTIVGSGLLAGASSKAPIKP
jgi:glycosyltransferase involved in cell wall biosynthesis